MMKSVSRRSFLQSTAAGAGVLAFADPPIQGFDDTGSQAAAERPWEPVSDRKIRFGLVGYGLSKFSTAFSLQDHPNVEVVAVSDLIPERCAELAKAARCEKTYPSLEELVKDDSIEAVFVATDAPSHARHCIEVLKHGKHVATAVPVSYGSVEDAERLYEAVKAATGLNFMMFETSVFHEDCYAAREIYNAGGFGKLVYSEGEYYHYMQQPLPSYKGWRNGAAPLWYPTHATAYYVGVTGGHFTEVSCMGMHSHLDYLQPEVNPFNNTFGTEIALFRTGEGGMARMTVSKDTPGFGAEAGRIRGQKGSMYRGKYDGIADISNLDLMKPALPPTVKPGGHGGSHGYLGHEFVMSILEERKPLVDIAWAMNMTVPGIIAHESALKDGELMKVPHYTF